MGREGRRLRVAAAVFLFLAALPALAFPSRAQDSAARRSADDAAVTRGAYIFQAAGCFACHTDKKGGGKPLAGGRALVTPFGTFYTPNITPDPKTGIGAWSEADFMGALRDGIAPSGAPLYPAFPYTSYSGMTDQDMRDLWAYLKTQPPVEQRNRPHDLDFPYNLRFTLAIWQALFFTSGPFAPDPAKSAEWNRGAYLVRHLGHCGECHTRRGFFGAVEGDQELAGNPKGPDGGKVPNLTPGPGGLGDWSESDIVDALKSGMTPSGDFLGDAMGEVIDNDTSHLTDADLAAIAKYLKDLPPRPAP